MSEAETCAEPEAPDAVHDTDTHLVVLFDGVCNFCNGSVNFIMKRDPKARFRFAALQSEAGEKLRERFGLGNGLEAMVLIRGDEVFTRSSAALRIAAAMRWPCPAFSAFLIVPGPIRDWFYKAFARRRYKWFGKRDTCRIPTAEEQARFL